MHFTAKEVVKIENDFKESLYLSSSALIALEARIYQCLSISLSVTKNQLLSVYEKHSSM